MLKSVQRLDAPIADQVAFWNEWNTETRGRALGPISLEQAETIEDWLGGFRRIDLDILDVGCGTGWLSARLAKYGRVMATDLSDSVLERAARRTPYVSFIAGDFMSLDLGQERFDVIASLEVLAHVADQRAFIAKLASLLRPGGYLMLATQNRPQLERNDLPPPMPGQIRHWLDQAELAALLKEHFNVMQLFSITPHFNRGYLRLVNSYKVNAALSVVGLSALSRWMKHQQERAGLGWTLMALAQKSERTKAIA